ncbi:unnamed protein product, partial [Dovyalis caffra]
RAMDRWYRFKKLKKVLNGCLWREVVMEKGDITMIKRDHVRSIKLFGRFKEQLQKP